ncbi:MAG: F0F1 ATP synthase subunit B [bacterium]|nr:F0F1 ATP synthase subunit B [bacterium]
MLIDWFTVGAQALNFLVLVWLLRRFLYRPILKAVDAREARIAKELADAAASKAETAKQSTELGERTRVFDQERASLLSKATDEAKVERLRLIGEAQKAADIVSAKRNEAMKSEAQSLNQAIGRRTQQVVFTIARKALSDLATTSLEERMGEVFTRRLRTMDGQAKARLGEALKTASAPSLVRSAFDLPPEQRAAIQNAVNETFSADIHLQFEAASDLIGGIELVANGQRVAWSIANYLGSLERNVSEFMKKADKPAVKAEPKPEANVKAKSESKVEPKPEATVEPEPEAAVKSTPDILKSEATSQ